MKKTLFAIIAAAVCAGCGTSQKTSVKARPDSLDFIVGGETVGRLDAGGNLLLQGDIVPEGIKK